MPVSKPENNPNSIWFIAGDWGTTNLRLFLCEKDRDQRSHIRAERSGAGISKTTDPETTFFEIADDWFQTYPNVEVILSGMVGSNIGWKEAPYKACPVAISDLNTQVTTFQARGHQIHILPGLSCSNILGHPDVMRGEETQVLGWLKQQSSNEQGCHLICLPGTHSKWVYIKDGRMENFLTGFTGELYDLLIQHSILLKGTDADSFNIDMFLYGVETIKKANPAELVHLLFSVRSKQLTNEIPADTAASYLSGLLIGADIHSALNSFVDFFPGNPPVNLIGDDQLNRYYSLALNEFDCQSVAHGATQMGIDAYKTVASFDQAPAGTQTSDLES